MTAIVTTAAVEAKSKGICILHVDDDETALIISKQILALEGNFQIDHALSVYEAFEKLATKEYDVIVSDYDMPGKNGLDFLKTLREQGNVTPFILFTGKGREDIAVKALNLGAEGYYNKQGDPETVYAELAHGIKLLHEKSMAKKAFEESEKRYRTIMENALEAIFVHDPVGRIIDVNRQACASLGFTREELLHMNASDLVDINGSTEEMRHDYWAKVLDGATFTFESLHKRKNNSVFPVEISLGKVVIAQKACVMASVRDMSQRKKVEEEMKMFYDILELATDAIVIHDLNGNFLYFNEETCKQRGYTREEFFKLTVPQITAPEYLKALKEDLLPAILQSGEGTFKSVNIRKDGSEMPVEIRARIVTFNDQKLILSVIRDATENEQRERALNESKEYFRQLALHLPEALCLFDNQTFKTLFANFNTFCGYSVAELETPYVILNAIHPADKSRAETYWKQAISAKSAPKEPIEYRMRTKDGDWKWIEARFILFNNQRGKPRQTLVTMKDITERKSAEEELRKSRDQLERLTETLKVTGSLTRHDVRNKLMVASSNLYLLKKKIGGDPELHRYIEGIELAIKQTDKLFEFSRLYEKIGAEKQVQVNVGACFNQATHLLFSDDKIQVENHCQDLTVTADSLLSQLFYNLIDNSIRHGKKVTRIKLSYKQSKKATQLHYEDDGEGIPACEKEKIFAEGYTTGGSGLGLKLVKKMIEAYGWTIKEVGTPGKGAKFQITINSHAI